MSDVRAPERDIPGNLVKLEDVPSPKMEMFEGAGRRVLVKVEGRDVEGRVEMVGRVEMAVGGLVAVVGLAMVA